jgi:hypothetical protein
MLADAIRDAMRVMVVWWYGGMVVWWYGGMVVWWYGDVELATIAIYLSSEWLQGALSDKRTAR